MSVLYTLPRYITHRFGLVSKEVDGGEAVLLHDAQTVPLVPAVRKHIEADLASCRGITHSQHNGKTNEQPKGHPSSSEVTI